MGISLQLPAGSPWRTVLRVCLILLAEAAVIAMLKDAPLYFQAATVITALFMLAVLEAENRLKQIHPRLFTISAIIVAAVYGCLCVSAIQYSIHESARREDIIEHLQKFYSEAADFHRRGVAALNAPDEEFNKLGKEVDLWGTATGKWILEHMGRAALDRVIQTSNSSLSYTGVTRERNNAVMNLRTLQENIGHLIDGRAWDSPTSKLATFP
jgi:hypothetical protein